MTTETLDTLTLDLRTPAGLRAWRLAHGLTQTQLGELLDVAYNTVNRWENGQRSISRIVELAIQWLELELCDGTSVPPPAAREWSAAEKLAINLLAERGDDGSLRAENLEASVAAFLEAFGRDLVSAAAAGDRRAMVRLRKDAGLPAFK